MKLSNRISGAWLLLKGQLPPSEVPAAKAPSYSLPLDKSPTALEEFNAFDEPTIYEPAEWLDPEVRAKHLKNADHRNDILEKQRFAKHAYRLNQVWIGFLIGITFLQGTRILRFNLDEWGFRIIFVSTTATVFGFALLVGKYLFPSNGRTK